MHSTPHHINIIINMTTFAENLVNDLVKDVE